MDDASSMYVQLAYAAGISVEESLSGILDFGFRMQRQRQHNIIISFQSLMAVGRRE
jgi:hypothetical protein